MQVKYNSNTVCLVKKLQLKIELPVLQGICGLWNIDTDGLPALTPKVEVSFQALWEGMLPAEQMDFPANKQTTG